MPFMIEDPNTGEQVELTPQNTVILLFPGDDLDHVLVCTSPEHPIACYDPELMRRAFVSHQFPITYFPFVPSFAVDRRMMHETPDFERLLDE